MVRYLVGRLLQTVLSMLVVVSIVFFLTRLSGNPVHLLLDVNASERDQEILTRHLGLMLILLFAVFLGVLPAGGRGGLANLLLPAFTLGYFTSAAILRLTRSSMLEVLSSDYVKFARLKGLHEQVVLWKHGLRNALLPVVTFAVLLFVQFLGGAVVTETVFAWPGLGRLILESITTRDYPIVQAGVLVLSALYLTGNLCVDLLYSDLNPKIR